MANWISNALGSAPSGSDNGQLNTTDALRALRVGLTVLGAQAAVLLLQYASSLNFGDKQVAVTALITMAIELIRRKYVNNLPSGVSK